MAKTKKIRAAAQEDSSESIEARKLRRRSTECTEVTTKHLQRRSYSEVGVLEAIGYCPFEKGRIYNFVTRGGTDMYTFLKLAVNLHRLDRCIISTWAANAEDLLSVFNLYREGRIKKLDFYTLEVFQNNYKIEWKMAKKFYAENPDAGRAAFFINHTKMVLASSEEDDFYMVALTSGNLNTNPRWEQAEVIIDKGTFDFYAEYFDGIKSIERHGVQFQF